jgi:hypothetical protein
MSGFAGLRMPGNRKQDTTGSRECARNSKKGFAGLVVGLVAPIERKKASGNEPMLRGFHGNWV